MPPKENPKNKKPDNNAKSEQKPPGNNLTEGTNPEKPTQPTEQTQPNDKKGDNPDVNIINKENLDKIIEYAKNLPPGTSFSHTGEGPPSQQAVEAYNQQMNLMQQYLDEQRALRAQILNDYLNRVEELSRKFSPYKGIEDPTFGSPGELQYTMNQRAWGPGIGYDRYGSATPIYQPPPPSLPNIHFPKIPDFPTGSTQKIQLSKAYPNSYGYGGGQQNQTDYYIASPSGQQRLYGQNFTWGNFNQWGPTSGNNPADVARNIIDFYGRYFNLNDVVVKSKESLINALSERDEKNNTKIPQPILDKIVQNIRGSQSGEEILFNVIKGFLNWQTADVGKNAYNQLLKYIDDDLRDDVKSKLNNAKTAGEFIQIYADAIQKSGKTDPKINPYAMAWHGLYDLAQTVLPAMNSKIFEKDVIKGYAQKVKTMWQNGSNNFRGAFPDIGSLMRDLGYGIVFLPFAVGMNNLGATHKQVKSNNLPVTP